MVPLVIYFMAWFYLRKCILNRRRKEEEEKKEIEEEKKKNKKRDKFIITHESAYWTKNIKNSSKSWEASSGLNVFIFDQGNPCENYSGLIILY